MKIVLGIILLVLSTYLGYLVSLKYTQRKNFYNDFCEFNKILKSEVSFLQTSLLTIVKRFYSKSSIFYNGIKKFFLDKEEVTLDKSIFKTEEREFFYSYLHGIGSADKETQLKFLDSVEPVLNEKAKSASDEDKKYRSLCLKLGFLVGLIAMIILL